MDKELPVTIIYTEKEQIWCMGEDLDHPKVYYNVPEIGTITCLYCNLQFTRDKKLEKRKDLKQ
ncbi:MAG: hypothetical protein CBB97_09335 [Candidatus Endolissoclinum sp. TMED37]|nr:MAG: hypothetical protein CBB97_09335 [Candidatus Endolissoclinum sp. TMED37]|tara:strand:- start:150 stop:338 length:189 start_codon:yes stop_codon:yes gene_type:complete